MPIVSVTKEMLATPADVWAVLCDVESYPRRMASVVALTELERTHREDGVIEAVTAWEVEIKGSTMRWRERERRDASTRTITYRQIDGDLEVFQGYWRIVELGPGRVEVTLEVEFEIGIELLRPMLEPVTVTAIRENSAQMLEALVAAGPDERPLDAAVGPEG